MLWGETARKTGLAAALSVALARWRKPRAVHDPGKILLDVAPAVALGGDCLADVGILRAKPDVLRPVASDPTEVPPDLGQAAGVEARAAAGDAAVVPREGLEPPVEGVVAVGGLLPGDGTGDGVAHEEDRGLGVVVSGQGDGQVNGVEGLIGTVRRPVDDEKDLLHGSMATARRLFSLGSKALNLGPKAPVGLSPGLGPPARSGVIEAAEMIGCADGVAHIG